MAQRFPWRSLTTRVTLLTLAIFMASMWSLSLYAGRMLRLDMQQQLGEQQFSTASFIAANIDRELGIRLDALQQISATVTPPLLKEPRALQTWMAQRPVFQNLFNGGTFATRLDGVPVASVTPAHQILASQATDAAHLSAFLATAAPRLIVLSDSTPPSIRMVVPLHSPQGQPMGALVGVIVLGSSNFLTNIAQSRYGQTGGYLLFSRQQRRVVTASDMPSTAGSLQPSSNHPAVAQVMRDPEGSDISMDPYGVEVLISNKHIPLANWSMSVMLPTEEAFAPVREQQHRIRVATVFLTLLAGLLTWWILKRQLAPLVGTVKALATQTHSEQSLRPLPLTQQYEIDTLIAGFNRLLTTLKERNDALIASVALNQNTLDSVAAQIAVLDPNGRVVAVNQPWQQFAAKACATGGDAITVGADYLALVQDCQETHEDINPQGLHKGIQAVLDGTEPAYTVEYPVQAHQQLHWFYMGVTPLGPDRQGVVISRSDTTERKLAGELLRKLSRVAEQAPLSIMITDLQGSIEYTNPYFTDKTGYSAHEVLGQNPRFLKSGLTPPEVYHGLWHALEAQRVWRGELHNRTKNGDLFVERAVIAPVLNPAGQVTHFVALKEDVTEDKKREQTRLSLSVRIEELSRRLVRAQEDIRLRFSQELHDRTSPNLAALRINLDIIAHTPLQAPNTQDFADRIDDTRALIEDTTMSIREICAGLHPPAIERGGLLGVVQSYAQQFAKRTAIQVHVNCPHGEIRLQADLELLLFRVVQEALTNCAKHAKARTAEVRLQLDSQPLMLTIADDGCGFDLDTMGHSAHRVGLGLLNMRETVEFAGGSFRLESAVGCGTRIYVEV
ncbi:MAG: PAS domain S-box protein [Rhodoferax sp.]|nr:PAS domain S-box protein [Rhodoferax sp.]MDP3651030.1 PAS domain S-box protein [Rhodoferax sp.]